MRFVVQRVSEAKVEIGGACEGAIGRGYMVLVGIADGDTKETADKMAGKMLKLRIFEDEAGKTNLSLADVGGEVLVISQFTLFANCKKGNRPSFTDAKEPGEAKRLYEYFVSLVSADVPRVACGCFGASMQVSLVNQGPFTIVLDTDAL